MTFATNSALHSSTRKILVRLIPKREVFDDVVYTAASTYEYKLSNCPGYIATVTFDGTAFAFTTGTPSAGQYSYNAETKLLTINSASAKSESIVIGYYLFYATEYTEANIDPKNANDVERQWIPRIKSISDFNFDLSDLFAGILNVSSGNLILANDDFDFNQYVTSKDTFYQRPIDIYFQVGALSGVGANDYALIYNGTTNNINIDREVSISFRHDLDKLNNIYYPNTTREDSRMLNFCTNGAVVTNDPWVEHYDKYARELFGLYTPSRTQMESSNNFVGLIDPFSALEAYGCDDITFPTAVTNNRKWGTIIGNTLGDDGTVNTTLSAKDQTPGTHDLFSVVRSPAGEMQIQAGDCLLINGNIARVVEASTTLSNVNIKVYPKIAAVAVNDPVVRPGIPYVCLVNRKDNSLRYDLFYSRDYTIQTEGNLREIVLNDGTGGTTAPETTFGITGPYFNPYDYQVFYKAYPDSTYSQSYTSKTILEDLLNKAGLSPNSSSFSSATSYSMQFTLPFYGSEELPSYRTVIQRILQSINGILSVNNDGEITHQILTTLSGGDVVTYNQIIEGSFRIEVDYNDVATNFEWVNENAFFADSDRTSVVYTDSVYKNLHGINADIKINDLLSGKSILAQPLINAYKIYREPMRRYYFDLGNRFDLNVGDELTLQLDGLLGSDTSRNVMIISINKNLERVKIIAIDLIGL